MKTLIQLRNKMGLVSILTLIIVALLLNNLAERRNFNNLEESMDAIYKDRLMASNYLYGITNALHEKHNIVAEEKDAERMAAFIAERNKVMDALITRYNATELTKVEAQNWKLLKTQLEGYSQLEKGISLAGASQRAALQTAYQQSLHTLKQLNDLQATEGKAIRKSSRAILLDTRVLSQTEIALLIVLGLIAMAISSVSDQKLFGQSGNPSLN